MKSNHFRCGSKKVLIAALFMLGSGYAHAQGDSVGHGGTWVQLHDDTIVVGDRFIPEGADLNGKTGQRIELSDELKSELKRAETLITKFGMYHTDHRQLYATGFSDPRTPNLFFRDNIFNPSTEYRMVESLKGVHCDFSEIPLEGEIAKHGAFGCTRGKYTYLISSVFSKMSLREKAIAIIHERLRATPLNTRDTIFSSLKKINLALEVGLNQFDREQKHLYIPLTVAEKQTLSDFSEVLAREDVTNNCATFEDQPHRFFPECILSGGALLWSQQTSPIPESAYFGIAVWSGNQDLGKIVSKNSILSPINMLEIDSEFLIGADSIVEGEFVIPARAVLHIGERTHLNAVYFKNFQSHPAVAAPKNCIGTTWEEETLINIGSDVRLVDSAFALINNSCSWRPEIKIADHADLKHVEIRGKEANLFRKVLHVIGSPVTYPVFVGAFVVVLVPSIVAILAFHKGDGLIKSIFKSFDRVRYGKVGLVVSGKHENIKCDFKALGASATVTEAVLKQHCVSWN